MVAIENTHNRGGGVVFPQQDAAAVCATARELGMASYLDGARLFNAAAASGGNLAELAEPFDLVSVALSKGLGCPVGSVLAGGGQPSTAPTGRGACSAGRCGRRGFSPPPGCRRSTTISTGSPKTTPMRES